MTPTKTRRVLLSCTAIAVAGVGTWLLSQHFQKPGAPTGSDAGNPQSARVAPLPLHPVVKQIVKGGPDTPYLKLNYVIKEIPTDLAQHDIDALLAFIMGPQPGKFASGEWGSLTNDIQEALSVQSVPNANVAHALIETFRDEQRSQLMRDYALQHIGGFARYLIATRNSRANSLPPFFASLVEELKSATTDDSKPWAGTAMNALDGLLRVAESEGTKVPGVDVPAFVQQAVKVAGNTNAPLNARLPALQVASRRKSPDALVLARAILADPNAHIMLVQSAAAVLGEMGGKDDIQALQGAIASNRPHTQAALQSALRKVSSR